MEKLRSIAPEETAQVERKASSNMNRYFARIAYEGAEYAKGLQLLREGFAIYPMHFLGDVRNWLTAAACASGLLLPRGLHRRLERLAGLRRAHSS